MASLPRRISSVLLAAALIGSLAEPALAQVSPAMPMVGPAGGTSSTTAPSNSEGTPAGGTGVIGTTRVGPDGLSGGRIVLNPQQGMSEQAPMANSRPTRASRRSAARQRRAVRRQTARASRPARAARPAAGAAVSSPVGGDASAAGLNGSNAPSR